MVLDRARSLNAASDAKGSVGSGGGYFVEYGNEGGGLRLILNEASLCEGSTVAAIVLNANDDVLCAL